MHFRVTTLQHLPIVDMFQLLRFQGKYSVALRVSQYVHNDKPVYVLTAYLVPF